MAFHERTELVWNCAEEVVFYHVSFSSIGRKFICFLDLLSKKKNLDKILGGWSIVFLHLLNEMVAKGCVGMSLCCMSILQLPSFSTVPFRKRLNSWTFKKTGRFQSNGDMAKVALMLLPT